MIYRRTSHYYKIGLIYCLCSPSTSHYAIPLELCFVIEGLTAGNFRYLPRRASKLGSSFTSPKETLAECHIEVMLGDCQALMT